MGQVDYRTQLRAECRYLSPTRRLYRRVLMCNGVSVTSSQRVLESQALTQSTWTPGVQFSCFTHVKMACLSPVRSTKLLQVRVANFHDHVQLIKPATQPVSRTAPKSQKSRWADVWMLLGATLVTSTLISYPLLAPVWLTVASRSGKLPWMATRRKERTMS